MTCFLCVSMDHILKIRHTIDAQFGFNASMALPSDVVIEYSKRTGRIRGIRDSHGKLLGTLRPDGGLAIGIYLAQRLLSRRPKSFAAIYCVDVTADAAIFVAQGRSVFCKHVVRCGNRVRANSDVPVTCDQKIIAVGKALLSCDVMCDMNNGVAVKIRDSLKSRDSLNML